MNIKWQWFLGGRIMFWASIILIVMLLVGFITTYVVDPCTITYIKRQKLDASSIQEISEEYVNSLRHYNKQTY